MFWYLYINDNDIMIRNEIYSIGHKYGMEISNVFDIKEVYPDVTIFDSDNKLIAYYNIITEKTTIYINDKLHIKSNSEQLSKLFTDLYNKMKLIINNEQKDNTKYEIYEILITIIKISKYYYERYLSLIDELDSSEVSFEALPKRAY